MNTHDILDSATRGRVNRKPIFDTVRAMLGRGFKPFEVKLLDHACDLAETSGGGAEGRSTQLGTLSEKYESGGRGPGAISGGIDDPGGVSYGVYQLASNTGTCAAFVKSEGLEWAAMFGAHKPGSRQFSSVWRTIAAAHPQRFREAQHAFIERTHYRPVVDAVHKKTGLDLDERSRAVRDVVWSCAVQHGGAARIVGDAIVRADKQGDRNDDGYDRCLIEAIYERRIEYVLGVAQNRKLPSGARNQLVAITRKRYPEERAKALAMLDESPWAELPASIASGAG